MFPSVFVANFVMTQFVAFQPLQMQTIYLLFPSMFLCFDMNLLTTAKLLESMYKKLKKRYNSIFTRFRLLLLVTIFKKNEIEFS